MAALIFLVLLLLCIGFVYPVAAVAYLKLCRHSKRSVKAILADL